MKFPLVSPTRIPKPELGIPSQNYCQMDNKRKEMNTELERHTCQSWHEGDWVYFHCPDCGFKRKLNWKTGDVKLLHQGKFDALHSGINIPLQLEELPLEGNN